MNTMLTISEIRRRNVIHLVEKELGGKRIRLAALIGRSTGYVSRMLKEDASGSRGIGNRIARAIEDALGKPEGWLDQMQNVGPEADAELDTANRLHDEEMNHAPGHPEGPPRWLFRDMESVPIKGCLIPAPLSEHDVQWQSWSPLEVGEPLGGWLPIAVAGNRAWAVMIGDRSISPVFKAGSYILMDEASPPLPGDLVFVEFSSGRLALARLGRRAQGSIQLLPHYGYPSKAAPRYLNRLGAEYQKGLDVRPPNSLPADVPIDQIANMTRVLGVIMPGSLWK